MMTNREYIHSNKKREMIRFRFANTKPNPFVEVKFFGKDGQQPSYTIGLPSFTKMLDALYPSVTLPLNGNSFYFKIKSGTTNQLLFGRPNHLNTMTINVNEFIEELRLVYVQFLLEI